LPVLVAFAAASIGGLVLVEAVLRVRWGLGSPVLYDLDPAMEYVQRPNQDLRRFGNRVLVNEWGMRSGPLPLRKGDPEEFRVLVIGDSVVNGGVQTDHDDLATTRVEGLLAARLARPVRVGNISAGSWGPPNLKAYLERHGFFDADVVVIVLGSHDAGDAPTGEPPNPIQYSTEPPRTAIGELLSRYVASRLPWAETPPSAGGLDRLDRPDLVERSLSDFRAILRSARDAGATPVLLQHWERGEVATGEPRPGHALLAEVADSEGVTRIQLREVYERFDAPTCFRDDVHLTARGQAALAEAIRDAVVEAAAGTGEREP
jgi:lysophospholipase L1-like esterase